MSAFLALYGHWILVGAAVGMYALRSYLSAKAAPAAPAPLAPPAPPPAPAAPADPLALLLSLLGGLGGSGGVLSVLKDAPQKVEQIRATLKGLVELFERVVPPPEPPK